MMEDDDDPPPFWLHLSSSRRRGSSPPIVLLILLFVVVAASLAAFVFLVSPYLSSSSSVKTLPSPTPKPHSIKKGWDTLNLVLVLFAVICGFLSRTADGNGNDNAVSASRTSSMKSAVTPRTPYRSYYYNYYGEGEGEGGYSEENRSRGYLRSSSFNETPTMRSSFSYPDLRQESAWGSYDVDRRRFYDDTSVRFHGFVDGEQIYERSGSRRWDGGAEEAKDAVQGAAVGNGAIKDYEQVKDEDEPQKKQQPPPPQPEPLLPLPSPPSPPPPPALPAVVESQTKHRRRMSYEAVHRSWKDDDSGDEMQEKPPSVQPPPPIAHRRGSYEEKISNKNGKKRGGSGSGSAAKEFFQSIGKKKKQRQKSIENLEALLGHPSSSDRYRLTLSPPPSSPPPLSNSVLQNLFSSKKSRNRNRKTAAPSSPPRRTSDIRKSKRPRNPEQPSYNTMIEEGNRSPLIPIPPAPPPPPPFRVPDWKFVVVRRDYLRIRSRESSGSDTPDVTEYEDDRSSVVSGGGQSLTSSPTAIAKATTTTRSAEGGENGMMFCPSPDVDTKADKFIARFREGLKLEKMNSWNQRQGGTSATNVRSNLGRSMDR